MADDWYSMLDRAKALGKAYAENGIAGGETEPEDAPLSGEFAGSISPRDIVTELAGGDADAYGRLADFEVDDILNHWEDGYNSAAWPNRQ